MEMKEFARKMCSAVAGELGNEYTVELKEVKKNNGVVLQGLLIHTQEQNVIPTIYLDSFWEAYEAGVPFASVLQKLMQIYHEDTPKRKLNMDFFYSLEGVKDRICYRLIKRAGNEGLLKEIPHVNFLDLSICFFYAFQNKNQGEGSILIYNTHMEMWKTDVNQLYELARVNTPNLYPWECCNMEAMLTEFDDVTSCEDLDEMLHSVPMEILSNTKRVHGATCIIYPKVAETLAGRAGGSYYILPSSIHELILLKDTGKEEPLKLKDMILEVNETVVAPEEVLSNSLYYYDCKEKRLKRLL